jgi:segregation and condensation protein B
MISLESQIESVLFVRTEGVTTNFLSTFLEVPASDIRNALATLATQLEGRGLKLLQSGDTCMLVTHPDMGLKIATLFDEDTTAELTPASLQTLSIILYKGTATRGEISYIRGVDSRMSLRNLLMRGLIEKTNGDAYRATTDTLRHLGVPRVEDLPRYKDISENLAQEMSSRRGE